jgi:transposase InsO family protein
MAASGNPPLPVVRMGEIPSQEKAQRWLVEGLWSDRSVGVIGGAPKCSKTWLGLDLALSVATGTACLGRYAVPEPGPVLVYLAEDALGVVREHFGGFERGIAAGLGIRHDHGSAYMSDDFQQELGFLGMTSSPSFVRDPEGNGVAERFIRTLKENLLWVRSFATVAELVEALREFRRRYNEQWLIERHGYRTPAQVRRDSAGSASAVA